jgi:dienelactone hydrolase
MSTTILDYRQRVELQPAHALWAQYQPENAPYRFQAQTPAEARQWQAETCAALAGTVGFQDRPAVPLAPRQIEVVDKGDYVREKVLLQTAPDTMMPVYLLLPKGGEAPHPVVIAFHGHGYGVKDIVGLWEDGEERNTPDGYHKDFAVALCRRGLAVAAPEISCFGERQTDFAYLNTTLGQGVPTTCTHTAMLAFHLGGSVIGLRVYDGKRVVDALQTRSDLDASRLGAMGISGGGLHTFFSTCLDPRIQACVISGYYSTFRDSVLAMSHCACNLIPGLGRFGEMYDLVGLIAPRPLLVEAGTRDPIFPIEAVKRSVTRAREVYGIWGAAEEIETDYFEGRHQISGRRACDFLWEKIAS